MRQTDGAVAPLSLWSVNWNGEEYLLDQPLRLAWDGAFDTLKSMTLTHGVRPDISTPRIWSDFSVSRPVTDLEVAIKSDVSAQHAFRPREFTDLISLRQSEGSMQLLNLNTFTGIQNFNLRNSIDDRASSLVLLAKDLYFDRTARSRKHNTKFCAFGSVTAAQVRRPKYSSRIEEQFRTIDAPTCEVYFAYRAILAEMMRNYSKGTWIAMMGR